MPPHFLLFTAMFSYTAHSTTMALPKLCQAPHRTISMPLVRENMHGADVRIRRDGSSLMIWDVLPYANSP